jgi:aspartate-semialdehyde dehydrogenase
LVKSNKRTKAPQFALVGAETLLGRELQEVLERRNPDISLVPYASSGEGNFGEEDGEAIYREALEIQAVRDVLGVLVAGSEAGALKALRLFQEVNTSPAGPKNILIDCTGHLNRQAQARIVAPLLEHPSPAKPGELLVLAHPAASALALVLTRLARHAQLRRAVVQIFEPASERGKRGIAELHQQTTGLLAFKPLDKEVFDNQLSFNLLAQYGAEAPEKLSAVERHIEEHLSVLLRSHSSAEPVPMPSLRLIQAPVFHGYSISAWVEFARDVNAAELGEALASAQIEVRGAEEEAPHGVGATSQSGLIAGDIRVDRNDARAAWFWIVGDNLRLTADGVADILGEVGTDQL